MADHEENSTLTLRGWLGDALLALMLVFLLPVAMLVAGSPIALVARLVIAIAHRL